MKKFGVDLRKHAAEIINSERKEMLPLKDKEIKSYNNRKFCYICRKKFCYVIDSNDSSNGDGDDEEFDARKFYGDAAGLVDLMIMTMMNLMV